MKYPQSWGYAWFWVDNGIEHDGEEDFHPFPAHASQFSESVKRRSEGVIFGRSRWYHHRDMGLPASVGKHLRSRMLKLKNPPGVLGSSLMDEISGDYSSGAVAKIACFTILVFVFIIMTFIYFSC